MTTAAATAMLDAALVYAEHGAPVFPVFAASDGRCVCRQPECGSPAKHPIGVLVPNGVKDATTDDATIRAWWGRVPQANIATSTSWCTVLDVDPQHGGDETLAELERVHGALPDTPEVITGGGGRHIYFRLVPRLGPSTGKVGPGLDIKTGAGAYVLLPPSTHVSGGIYHDDVMYPLFDTPLALAPAWLVALASAPASSNGSTGHAETDWVALLNGAAAGQRHDVAVRIAGHYLGKRMPPAEVEAILLAFAGRCAPPFDPEDCRRIVRDLAAKDAARATQEPPQQGAPSADGPVRGLGIGLGQFIGQEFPESMPLIEGILSADGCGWLGGEEKVGKTFWALDEALALSTGQPVAGKFRVPARQRVLVIEEEDPPRRAHSRIRPLLRGRGLDPDDLAVRADLDEWFRIEVWSGFTLDDPAWVGRLEATCAEFQPAVVYIDVLRKVTAKDISKAVEMAPLLASLDTIRRTHGTVFRIVHHYRKQQGFRTGRGSQELNGSYVLAAWAECSLFFEPVGRKQGAVRVEVQVKDGPPVPGFNLTLQSEGPAHAPTLVRLIAEDAADEDDADEVVFQAIASLPKVPAAIGTVGVPIEALVHALKKSDKTLRRAIKRLMAIKRVVVTGKLSTRADLFGVNSE